MLPSPRRVTTRSARGRGQRRHRPLAEAPETRFLRKAAAAPLSRGGQECSRGRLGEEGTDTRAQRPAATAFQRTRPVLVRKREGGLRVVSEPLEVLRELSIDGVSCEVPAGAAARGAPPLPPGRPVVWGPPRRGKAPTCVAQKGNFAEHCIVGNFAKLHPYFKRCASGSERERHCARILRKFRENTVAPYATLPYARASKAHRPTKLNLQNLQN